MVQFIQFKSGSGKIAFNVSKILVIHSADRDENETVIWMGTEEKDGWVVDHSYDEVMQFLIECVDREGEVKLQG
jgi:hypothetical protein